MMDGCVKSSDPSVAFSFSQWTHLACRNWLNKNYEFMWKKLSSKIGLLNRQYIRKWCILGSEWHEPLMSPAHMTWGHCLPKVTGRTLSLTFHFHVCVWIFLPSTCRSRAGDAIALWWSMKCTLNGGLGWEAIGPFWFWWPAWFCGGLWIMHLILPGDVWGGGGGGTDRTEIFLPLFYVPINQRWSLSSFENCLQSLSHLSIWGWFCLVEFLPPSHFAAKCWFLLSWRARFAFDAPLLSESYIPLMWVICLCVLLNYGFGYLDVSHSMLLAVGKERRLAVKACSAILPTLGNRHWHLLCSRYWPCQQSPLW